MTYITCLQNFNNFAGRGYVPGPVGNNRDRTDPNAAMLSLDWFEFGRARGSTLMCAYSRTLASTVNKYAMPCPALVVIHSFTDAC